MLLVSFFIIPNHFGVNREKPISFYQLMPSVVHFCQKIACYVGFHLVYRSYLTGQYLLRYEVAKKSLQNFFDRSSWVFDAKFWKIMIGIGLITQFSMKVFCFQILFLPQTGYYVLSFCQKFCHWKKGIHKSNSGHDLEFKNSEL